MRRLFADTLFDYAIKDKRIHVLTGDLGYGMWDKFFQLAPEQITNCGASEQAMTDIAVGMAYAGKIPFVYSITPFLLYRPFETIKLYLNYENLPVKLIGSGMEKDYHIDGPSHDATGVEDILKLLLNIQTYYPKIKEEILNMVKEMIENNKPCFIGLRR
jgi:transketolase